MNLHFIALHIGLVQWKLWMHPSFGTGSNLMTSMFLSHAVFYYGTVGLSSTTVNLCNTVTIHQNITFTMSGYYKLHWCCLVNQHAWDIIYYTESIFSNCNHAINLAEALGFSVVDYAAKIPVAFVVEFTPTGKAFTCKILQKNIKHSLTDEALLAVIVQMWPHKKWDLLAAPCQ